MGVARELWGYVIWGAMFDIRQLGYRLLWDCEVARELWGYVGYGVPYLI